MVANFGGERDLYLQWAAFYKSQGEEQKVIDTYKRGLERLTDDPVLLHGLAYGHTQAGEVDAANAVYRRLLRVDRDSLEANNNLAWNLAQRDESLDEALELAQHAQSLAPRNAGVMDTVAYVHLKRTELSSAERLLRSAIEMENSNPVFHYHLAMVLEGRGAIEEALESLEKALSFGQDFEGRQEAEKLREQLRAQINE